MLNQLFFAPPSYLCLVLLMTPNNKEVLVLSEAGLSTVALACGTDVSAARNCPLWMTDSQMPSRLKQGGVARQLNPHHSFIFIKDLSQSCPEMDHGQQIAF